MRVEFRMVAGAAESIGRLGGCAPAWPELFDVPSAAGRSDETGRPWLDHVVLAATLRWTGVRCAAGRRQHGIVTPEQVGVGRSRSAP